jgi:uncharacterized protein (DUF305 family)
MPRYPYRRLMLMAALSFMSMYGLMYMMVDRIQNIYPHVNQFYMAGMMVAPMIILELVLMSPMYPNKRRNMALLATSAVFGVLCIAGMRTQTGVTDEEFMKSMIPHHAGAILMCQEAPLTDSSIQELCRTIVASQQREIDWMKGKLDQP